MNALAAEGITSASDANTGGWEDIEIELSAYRAALESGRMVGRIILMPHITTVLEPESDGPARLRTEFDAGDQPERLRIGATKIFSDGALTTRTAAVREPYLDTKGLGLLTWEPDVLKSMIRRAHRAGWQIATHAIGDRAIAAVLDAYEAAHGETPRTDARHRIEHCTLADEAQVARIKALGVAPVLQPEDIAVLGDAYVPALGRERADDNSPVRWFVDRQAPIAFSSDRPVTPGSPFWGIRAAMERRTPEGVTMGARHRVSAEEAIRFYTCGSAYATFSERQKGSLRPGMLADFVVLDRDITRVLAEEVTDTVVVMTVVGGEIVYARSR
jgi:predicted amidohydrolase YtcJ